MDKKLEARIARLERMLNLKSVKNEDASSVEKWNEYSLTNQIVLIKDRLDECVNDLKHLAYDSQAYEHGMDDDELLKQLDSTVLQLKNAIKAVDSLAWSANELEQEIEYAIS